MKNIIRLHLFAGVGILAASCQVGSESTGSGPDPEAAEDRPTPLEAEPAVEVARLADDAALAFRVDGRGYAGGYLTHEARIEAGRITLTPSHWTGAKRQIGAPITLETRSIERGGEMAADEVLQTRAVRGDSLELDRGGVLETIDNLPEGIEQSWRFANEPTGTGDLVVRVAAGGFAEATATPTGVHLMNPGKLGVRYSNATWIDSAGEAWSLPSTWDGTDIVITVPADMIDRTTFPAVLDPTVGGQTAVDQPVQGFTGAAAREPSAAFSGTNWLVVWRDNRHSSTDSDIYGARIGADGTVLDARGIAINTAAGDQTQPTVTYANGKWVVVWESGGDLVGATVGGAGAVTQLGTVVATGAADTHPRLAAHGTTAGLTFESGTAIAFSRYSGTAFGAPVTVSATGTAPAIGANPTGDYLVSWFDGIAAGSVLAQRVDPAGALAGSVIIVSAGAGTQRDPSVGWTGTDFVVAFTNVTSDLSDIYATRVSTSGVVADTHMEDTATVGGIPISAAAGNQVTSTTSCNAGGCLIGWSDRRVVETNGADIYAQRVNAGLVLQGGEVAISTPVGGQTVPVLAAGPTSSWLAVWADERTGGPLATTAARITAAGAVQDASGIVVNTSRNAQRDPAYASGGDFQLAVWSDSRSYGSDTRAVRYNAAGDKLDTEGVAVAANTAHEATPAASYDGTQFLVVWDDGRNQNHDIFAGRFSTAGAALDGAGIPITTAANDQFVPDVASNAAAGVSLVVWQDRRDNTTSGFDIYGAIVTAGGVVSVADIPICTVAGDQNRPAVTYDAVNDVFVVAWSDVRVANDADVYAARVTPAGAVLDAGGIAVSTAAEGQFSPDLAASGGQILAVWDDRRTDNGDIYGARLTAAGSLTVLDAGGIAVNASADAQVAPTVIEMSNGMWVVAWADDRNLATTNTDIYAVQVTAGGLVTSAAGDLISALPDAEGAPALQPDPNSALRISLVYRRFRADLDTSRVERRRIRYLGGPQGAVCTANDQCLTGFCSDGFCCDNACGGGVTGDCQACSVNRGATVNGTCAIVPATRLCRGFADPAFPFCDVRERCNGVDPTCPPDLGKNGGAACTDADGPGFCPPADVTGSPHVCQ